MNSIDAKTVLPSILGRIYGEPSPTIIVAVQSAEVYRAAARLSSHQEERYGPPAAHCRGPDEALVC